MRSAAFGAAALACVACGTAWGGEVVSGRAVVIDGDTLRLRDTAIGLLGVAAPGIDQTCEDRGGRKVPCGRQAARALAEHIGEGSVTCETRGLDSSGRLMAICRIGDEDLNAWMVSSGLAVSERFADATYFAQETKAWAKRRGLWAGVFEDPTGRRRAAVAPPAVLPVSVGEIGPAKRTDGAATIKLTRLAR